ncbi:phosphatidylglycerol lysyltransferase domain-containing protein [Propionibacterium freudenreichii]|uniref:phosphatidylglycerol lysyltransferase domain-containing protein n=1 Tax=Propionibacterium freudenreichii TaxID=1744 RepID=UPI0021A8FEF1|nr:phosphatidylglycerol lysyltransferase domain-containing protein [Propionibacterium freudenreichii]MCT2993655.1 DUF2156 domain-containing protein [Propionibacterium freudenreichii]MDK9663497.1 DUF2156 domain-containing protein [Propionibacterium freudenreichii]
MNKVSFLRRLGNWLTSPRVLALLIGVGGIINVVGVIAAPHGSRRMRMVLDVFSPTVVGLASVATAIVGLVLIALSTGLKHRKRVAWWLAVAMVVMTVLLHVVKGFDFEQSIAGLVVLALLVAGHRHFTGIPDPRSRRSIWTTVILAPLAGITLGTVLLTATARTQAHDTTLVDRIVETVVGMVGISGPVVFIRPHWDDRWFFAMLMIGVFVIITILVALLRSPNGPHSLHPDEENELRSILPMNPRIGSLDYFATRRDRGVMVGASRRAAISYRVVGGVSLAGGDPLGEPGQWGEVVDAWIAEANRYGWLPAVLACGEEAGRLFADRGMEVLHLGDEAIIDVADFSLAGRVMKPVRNTVNHAKRDGVVVDCLRAKDLSALEVAEVRTRADEWRDGPVERGFSMALGRFGDPADGECVLVRARVDGQIVGLLYMVPWGKDGLSLDLMRRSPQAPNGVVESMVTGLVDWGRDNHLAHISLNFAVLRDIFQRGEELGADPVTKVAYNVLMFLSRFLQLDSLYRSNVKYQPRWQPRYICYEPGSLVEVAVACLRAEAFLTLPSFGRRRRQSRKWTELEATEQYARREAGARDGQDDDSDDRVSSKDATRAVGKDLPGVAAAEAVTKGDGTPVGSKDELQGEAAKAADGEAGNESGPGKAGDKAVGDKAVGGEAGNESAEGKAVGDKAAEKGAAAGGNPEASSSEDRGPSGPKAD